MTNLLQLAFAYSNLGYSVIPVAADGTKRPGVPWKEYAERKPSPSELVSWFGTEGRFDGLGFVCGAVSGGLVMLELEGRAVAEDMVLTVADTLENHGMADLWARLQGYVEHTPSGGMHWYFRIAGGDLPGNMKIARRRVNDKQVDVLIETRGEGGFTVIAPSAGRSHPSGAGWTVYTGSVEQIPTITDDEAESLFGVLSILDEMPKPVAAEPAQKSTHNPLDGVRPGDDYNERATWEEILEPLGWSKQFSFPDGGIAWCRPGKRMGISASTGRNDGDNLYVFSTSTHFDTEVAYSKFHAYTHLHHNGDFTAAAKALRSAGYGSQPKVAAPPALTVIEGGRSQGPTAEGTAALEVEDSAAALTYSDDGMAMLLVQKYEDIIRRCADRGRWYAWNGHVWAECPKDGGVLREYAKDIARRLPEHTDKAVKWKTYASSARGISSMLTQASTDSRICVQYADLDAQPWELNTPGGIVDLRTGQIGPSDPSRLHTRSTGPTPSDDVDRRVWDEFLNVTFNGDQALIEYVQRLAGYSAIGHVGVHVLPYCYGLGGNGKGVFLETIRSVLGDYATTAPAGFLMQKAYAAHETEIARMSGARFVLCSEVNESDRFDEAKVKWLTGGDTLTGRFMQQDHFTFDPTHTLWSMGNFLPGVQSGGDSFWRRLRTIPFVHKVPEDKRIDDLQGILARDHGAAVLSWIIEGAAKYAQGGLGDEPEIVRVATEDYAHDQDTVSRFLDEMAHIGGGSAVQIRASEVRTAYEVWCHETGDEPVTAKSFSSALRRAGIGSNRSGGNRFYTGITLLRDESSSSDENKETTWWQK